MKVSIELPASLVKFDDQAIPHLIAQGENYTLCGIKAELLHTSTIDEALHKLCRFCNEVIGKAIVDKV